MPAPDPDLIALATSLRKLRRDRELSQEELAMRSGLHPNHISQIERGTKDVRASTLFRILDALGASAAELDWGEASRGHAGHGRLDPARRHDAQPRLANQAKRRDDLMERLDEAAELLVDVRAALAGRSR